jgi:hypothetical protein
MPIEIKELHIKATVVDRKSYDSSGRTLSSQEQERMKKEIVKSCVQEVLQILEDKKER